MSDTNPLAPLLEDAKAELSRRLREACEAEERGVSTDSTQEIRKLEDTLLAAAVAAEQTIAVRRHMKRQQQERPDRARPIETAALADRKPAIQGLKPPSDPAPEAQREATRDAEAEAASAQSTVVHEFTDSTGRGWRAWPVTPRVRAGPGRRFLGSFQDGWICFEAIDSPARRRLPRHHPAWAELREEELQALLGEAITAPPRAKQKPD